MSKNRSNPFKLKKYFIYTVDFIFRNEAGNGTDYLLAFVIVQFEFGGKTLDGMSFNYFF